METILNHMFYISQTFENPKNGNLGKDARRKMMKSRVIKSRTSWIWDQYLSENMTWQFGKMKP